MWFSSHYRPVVWEREVEVVVFFLSSLGLYSVVLAHSAELDQSQNCHCISHLEAVLGVKYACLIVTFFQKWLAFINFMLLVTSLTSSVLQSPQKMLVLV